MISSLLRTKYAVFHPGIEKFASKSGGWTEKLDEVQTYVSKGNARFLLQKMRAEEAQIVAATFVMTWKPVTITLEETPRYQKHKANYDELLTQAVSDPEAMKKKDWESFKKSRGYLREVGVEVVKL